MKTEYPQGTKTRTMQTRPDPELTPALATRDALAWNRAIEAAACAARRLALETGSGDMALGALRASEVIGRLRRDT
jgi:hypothetical protein